MRVTGAQAVPMLRPPTAASRELAVATPRRPVASAPSLPVAVLVAWEVLTGELRALVAASPPRVGLLVSLRVAAAGALGVPVARAVTCAIRVRRVAVSRS